MSIHRGDNLPDLPATGARYIARVTHLGCIVLDARDETGQHVVLETAKPIARVLHPDDPDLPIFLRRQAG
jgi:hypothetical protein